MDLKTRIEKVLSEILSDKYECKVTLHFEKKEGCSVSNTEESRPGSNAS